MSNNESFIDEVSEAVRQDRLYAMFRKYGWIAILAVVVIVGGAAWREYSLARDTANARAEGDAILAAMEKTTPEERQAAFDAMPAGRNGAVVAELLAASVDVGAGDLEGAATRLEAIAADPLMPQIYRDLATLKAVMTRGTSMEPTARIAALQPVAVAGRPFRLLANEQIALAQLDAGDSESAIATLNAIVEDAEVSQSLRDRAMKLIVALGGSLAGAAQ